MALILDDSNKYDRQFLGKNPLESERKALEYALDIRKFEIELYWKRASYFWTLIAAAFVAFFALGDRVALVFLVACLGFLLSLGWYLVNRGSKYWQENWEAHVTRLEGKVIGPLDTQHISPKEFRFLNLTGGYPYSVSRVNQVISLYVTLVWLALGTVSFPPLRVSIESRWSTGGSAVAEVALAVVTLIFAGLLLSMRSGLDSADADGASVEEKE
ncbi:MAG: hypothetical protein O2826_12140 [Chloroflexi bacterium]|nr:hypothetical protein [Chloroflexota bacterium]MDA1175247.1 hypothetical protein [Chloroflexota bacterium]